MGKREYVYEKRKLEKDGNIIPLDFMDLSAIKESKIKSKDVNKKKAVSNDDRTGNSQKNDTDDKTEIVNAILNQIDDKTEILVETNNQIDDKTEILVDSDNPTDDKTVLLGNSSQVKTGGNWWD